MFIYVNTGVIYSFNLAFTLGLHRLLSGFGEKFQAYYLKVSGKHLLEAKEALGWVVFI